VVSWTNGLKCQLDKHLGKCKSPALIMKFMVSLVVAGCPSPRSRNSAFNQGTIITHSPRHGGATGLNEP